MDSYIIFGDSIACGEGDPHGGWVKLLGEKHSLKNLSIDGATTADYLKNFPAGLNKNSTFIIALGVNDSARLSLREFQQNLIQLIKLAKKSTQEIIFIGPAPIDQIKVDPVPWDLEISYQNNLVQKFNQVMDQVARKEKIKFIDLFNKLPPEYIKTLEDGVHPNHAGHQMIFEIINSFLKKI